jgi:hypothetical protein
MMTSPNDWTLHMAKKPPHLAGKPLTGALAEPIDIVTFGLPEAIAAPGEFEKYKEAKNRALFEARRSKIVDLAKHLGLDVENNAYTGSGGREFLLECTLMALADAAGVPGFQKKNEGKWPDGFIFWVIQGIERAKLLGRFVSDHESCKEILVQENPGLAKRARKSELDALANQLENRVSILRSTFKKAKNEDKTALHKITPLGIVKH